LPVFQAAHAVNSSTSDTEAEPKPPGDPPVFSAPALEQYQKCPRRFYYERILRLPERDRETTYLGFHQSVGRTLEWLQAEQNAGQNPNGEEVLARFNMHWDICVQDKESAQARVLRARAEELLTTARQTVAQTQRPQGGRELVAKLEHGHVRLVCDQAEE